MLLKLENIKSSLEDADRKQNSINKKHNQYVGATLDRINYLKNRDEDFKGNLVSVLNIIAEDDDDRIIDIINDKKLLISSEMYNDKAPYRQKFPKEEFKSHEISKSVTLEDESELKNEKQNIIRKNSVKQIYKFRDSVIKSFMEKNIGSSDYVTTRDFNIEDNDDFIKFVMAYKMCQMKKSQYESRIIDDEIIEFGEFKLPNIEYRRKK